ncbi:hypothetical protein CEXT_621581 [Caerostris extrusa]|uniref:Uncharacterized protein n=1 Tax=Caerostris extrusa TaxID=172846 RepID=A0AAV4X993_CAEEX|nr:hypothetical protein CEXT_621581 [Caerostris extrusa]
MADNHANRIRWPLPFRPHCPSESIDSGGIEFDMHYLRYYGFTLYTQELSNQPIGFPRLTLCVFTKQCKIFLGDDDSFCVKRIAFTFRREVVELLAWQIRERCGGINT